MDAAKADVLGVHRVPPTALAKDLEHQPARASEQGTSDAGPECLLPNEVAVIRLVGAILANTTMAAGNTAEEVDKLRRGGDGHIVVWGGVSFWRSLMRLDLIDEFRQDLYPHVAGEDTGLFDDVPKSYRLDLVSSTAFSNGTVGLTTAGTANPTAASPHAGCDGKCQRLCHRRNLDSDNDPGRADVTARCP